jgi:hypothetical protein
VFLIKNTQPKATTKTRLMEVRINEYHRHFPPKYTFEPFHKTSKAINEKANVYHLNKLSDNHPTF